MKYQNPDCDGDKCRKSVAGEGVRLLPIGGSANIIVCRACYEHEIAYRRERNAELGKDCQYDLPSWDSLTKYGDRTGI